MVGNKTKENITMKENQNETCKTCTYFLYDNLNSFKKECRKHAPITLDGCFPHTWEQNWCGDYEEKIIIKGIKKGE
jgi:acyl carrier protein phosphodiesterase